MGILTLDDLFEPPDKWNLHWRCRDWRELLPIVRERIISLIPGEQAGLPDAQQAVEKAAMDYINWLVNSRWYANAKRPTT